MKKQRVALLILCLLASLFLAGCNENQFDKTADAYFAALRSRNYAAMAKLFTPQSAALAGEKTIAEYYGKVYDLLKVKEIATQVTSVTPFEDRTVYNYTLTLTSEEYGSFSYDSVLTVARKLDFYLVEWSPANVLPDMQWEDRIFKSTVKGRRGEIFDCNGYPLIVNDFAVTVYAQPARMADTAAGSAAAAEALGLTGEAAAKVGADILKAETLKQDTVIIASYLKGAFTPAQEEAIAKIQGVYVDRTSLTPIRYQTYDSVASHILGYSTPITPEDRKDPRYKNLPEGTRLGRSGIELACNDRLLGSDGFEIYLLSADSKTKTVLYAKEAVNGQDVKLTIDVVLQARAEKILEEYYKPDSSNGSVTVIEPTTGAVKVLASYPTFSLNLYAQNKPDPAAADLYKEGSGSPTLNRATQGLYPPGSVMKSFTALMGLDSGTVKVGTVFPYAKDIVTLSNTTEGWKPAGSRWTKNIVRQRFARASSMQMDMTRGLVWSDNIYFGWLGMEMGAANFIDYTRKIGIGDSWQFDLPMKKSSLHNENTDLAKDVKLLADSAYGQGEVLTAPLQMAATFSLFGNGGDIMQPYLISAYCSTDALGRQVENETLKSKILYPSFASKSDVKKVNEIMEQVYLDGSGKAGKVSGITVAAKTGTAQTGNNITEIGWYAGQVTEGGLPYTFMLHLEGPKQDTGDAKFGSTKAIITMLKEGAQGS